MALTTRYAHDGTTIELTIGDLGTFENIDSVSYGWTRDPQKLVGAGDKARKRTKGVFNAEDAQIDVWADTYFEILSKVGGSPKALSEMEMDVVIKYRVTDEDPLVVEKLIGCVFIGASGQHPVGTSDKLVNTLTLQVMDIVQL